MLTRRNLLLGSLVATVSAAVTLPFPEASAHHTAEFKRRFRLDPRHKPQTVRYSWRYKTGTIIIDTRNHFLYLIERPGRARRYGVGVGRAGLGFKGGAIVQRKAKWPRWTPTRNMIRREPHKYARHAGGVPGGINNPMGARALYLYKNGRDTMYRIHGTNQPSSIGRSVSNGCIRMINDHVIDLYNRVPTGTKVVVL